MSAVLRWLIQDADLPAALHRTLERGLQEDPAARQADAATWLTEVEKALMPAPAPSDEVIVLETDILFASNTWDLPGPAAGRIAELAAEIPEGASVQIGGHTDSLPVDQSQYGFDNQQLSEHRAQAVADALTSERPDLTLEVTGHGSQQPAATENPDDPSTYSANRRVELRYGD